MENSRDTDEKKRRSDEIILVGYFLSRCTDFSDGSTPRPPRALNASGWNEAYDLFFDCLSEGRSQQQFRHTLRNTRDIFDSLFDNGRKGWSDGQKRGPELSDRDIALHQSWQDRSDEDLIAYVFQVTSIETHNRQSKANTLGNDPKFLTGSFSPVYTTAPNPEEADWVPPSDLPTELEIQIARSKESSAGLGSQETNSLGQSFPATNLTRKTKETKGIRRQMHKDRIGPALWKIIEVLEMEIETLNAEGASLFSRSQYEDASRFAELGSKMQTFHHRISEIRSDWIEFMGAAPMLGEADDRETTRDQNDARRKSPRKSLVVTIDDGKVISGRTAAETFVQAIVGMGVDRVEGLGIEVNREPLVSDSQSKKYNTAEIDGKYIMTHSSTAQKKDLLERIADELGVIISVDIS